MRSLHGVVLAGGSGTRFWPVSRRAHPKQLMVLKGQQQGFDGTLLSATLHRISTLVEPQHGWLVVGNDHAHACRAAVPQVKAANVLVEPKPRNTAMAACLAAVHLEHAFPDCMMAILPADHFVRDVASFCDALETAAMHASRGVIALLGVVPTEPETAYGYIEADSKAGLNGCYPVKKFYEKPSRDTALKFIQAGAFYWNAGIFVMKPSTYLQALERFLPAMHRQAMRLAEAISTPQYDTVLQAAYNEAESISIDYGVMEHVETAVVVPVDCGWSDVGSWNALSAVLTADAAGNRISGRAVAIDSTNCTLFASEGHVVAVVGMQDTVVVHTPDATLVLPNNRAQSVRDIHKALSELGWAEYL